MKNLLLKFLTIAFVFTLSLGVFTACGEAEETPTHIHDYKILKFDTEGHWFECECKEKINSVQHTIVGDTCICGYNNSVTHVHNFNKKINVLEYLASEATCTEKAKYYYVCSCLEAGAETYEIGEVLSHDYSELRYDDENHWYECVCGDKQGLETHDIGLELLYDNEYHWSECFCGYKHNIESHIGGIATETEKAVCEVCNQEYGDYAYHVHSYDMLYFDNEYHWYGCSCGEILNEEYHTGGTATCKVKAICEVCNQSYGEFASCIYEDGICIECGGNQPSEGLVYELFEDYCTVVSVGDCTDVNIVIPATYENKPVTKISNSAFAGCDFIESIELPDTIVEISPYAFYGCYSLTTVTIGNSVTSIGDCSFSWCSSLTSIVLPNSVISIGNFVFSYCSLLTSLVLPSSVTSIGNSVFSDCSSLTSIEIPNSVTSIGELAFYNCSLLSSVTIGNSVTSIGSSAFENCSSLTFVLIPISVTNMGSNVFYNCISLTIYCEAESQPTDWNSDWNSSGCFVLWGYVDN